MSIKVINLKPTQLKWNFHSDSFTLVFYGQSKNKKTNILIKLRFDLYWINIISRNLWEIIKFQKKQLSINIKAMRGDLNE